MGRRSILAAVAAAVAAFAAGGCGSDEAPATPSVCIGEPGVYLDALRTAPGEVRLAGTTAISLCLPEEQAPGALAGAGEAMIAAASELNREILALRERGPDAAVELEQRAVELGYLVGAVQEAAAGTGGIHQDLVLRLDRTARYQGEERKPFDAAFERAFGEGYTAGQATG